MGQEATCRVRFEGKASEGKARLEAAELTFAGAFRLRVPFEEMTSFEARRGELTVRFPGGTAVFELGARAEPWALKIRYPRGLMDKLGVKAGLRVSVLGIEDANFWDELATRGADVARGRVRRDSDLIFVGLASKGEIRRLKALRDSIKKDGAIWVIWPKGKKELREDDVRAAGPGLGLVDVKVASVSERLSGLKMMIPVKLR